MTRATSVTFALAAVLSGCFGPDTSSSASYASADIVNQAPQGSMGGNAWTMQSAVVRVDSWESNKLSVTLYGDAVEACDAFAMSTAGEIIFSVPRATGSYPLNFSFSSGGQTITFVPAPGQNVISTEGLVVVEAVSDTEVTIGLVADAGSSHVNGRVTTALCP